MPWLPELFSAPALQRILDERRDKHLTAVPYFDGLIAGETDALIASFAGEPELHHPVRGRIRGADAFGRFVTNTNTWIAERNVTIEDVNLSLTPRRGIEEVVLHIDGDDGRIELPLALAADRDKHARIVELRVYFSTWPLTGAHATRPPLLQPEPDLHAADVVGDYQRALTSGDVDAILATFEPDGSMREPAGAPTSTAAPTSCARCTSCSSPTAAASRWSTAPSPTTVARVPWSTTSSPGAAPSCPPRRASPCTCAATAAGSPPRACTTTPTRR